MPAEWARSNRVMQLIQDLRRLGTGATVGTIIIDSGLRYVSADVFRT